MAVTTGAGDILPRPGAVPVAAGPMAIISERRDGGRGMAMLPPADAEVGVGICLPGGLPSVADDGADMLMSPSSEKISPRSAYRLLAVLLALLLFDSVGLCSGA